MRHSKHLSQFKISKSGQALVEFALVAPLLILLLLGIISYGMYINANVTIEQAARVGARAAAIGDSVGCPGDSASSQLSSNPPEPETIYGMVDNQINQGFGLSAPASNDSPQSFLTPPPEQYSSSSAPSEDFIQVNIAYPYTPIIPIPGLLPAKLTIAQSYSMMVQVAQNSSNLSTASGSNTQTLVQESPASCTS